MSHAANDDSYLNLMIFGPDYSNLLLADTSTRLKKRRLPYRRKVGLKYFSDTCRAWLLTRSSAWETSVSWKRNVSRAFQSYIPIERANLLGESHSRYPRRPFPAHRGSFAPPEEDSDPCFGQPFLRADRESTSIGNQGDVSRGFLTGILEEGAEMFDNSLMTEVIKRMAKRPREKSRRSAWLAGNIPF